jgi:hypothetical protein
VIVYVDDNGRNRLVVCKGNIIQGILITQENILDENGLEVLVENSNINLLLPESVFASEIASLLYLKLYD